MLDSRKSEYETEELEDIRELIHENKRRLHELEVKAARFGAYADPQIINEIKDIRRELAPLEARKLELEKRKRQYEREIERGEKQEASLLRMSDDTRELGIMAFILCSVALIFWFVSGDKILVISMTLGIGICLLFTLVIKGRQSR